MRPDHTTKPWLLARDLPEFFDHMILHLTEYRLLLSRPGQFEEWSQINETILLLKSIKPKDRHKP